MYLILAQIHLHILNLVHQIGKKLNTLKKGKTLFETSMKLFNLRFEKIKAWEGVASHKKVITKDLLLKILKIRENNFLEYLCTAKILSYFILTNLRWKRTKYVVLLLSFLFQYHINWTTLILKRITYICTSKHSVNRN